MKVNSQPMHMMRTEVFLEESDNFQSLLQKYWGSIGNKLPKIDGFRNGKYSLKLAMEKFGINWVLDVLKPFIDSYIDQVVKGVNLKVAAIQNVHISPNFVESNTPTITLVLYLYPIVEFKDLDFEPIVLNVPKLEDAMMNAVRDYASRLSTSKQVDKISENCEVTVDLEFYSGNSKIGYAESYNLKMGNIDDPFYGVMSNFVGRAVEENFGITNVDSSKFPEYAGAEDLNIKVKIISIREIEFPDIDDEFAVDSGFSSLDHMKAEYRWRVASLIKSKILEQFRKIFVRILRKKAIIPAIPDAMVANYLDSQWSQERAKKGHVSDAELENILSMPKAEYFSRFSGNVRFMLENRILMTSLCQKEEVEVTKEDHEKAIKKFFEGIEGVDPEEEFKKTLSDSSLWQAAKENAMMEKCFYTFARKLSAEFADLDSIEEELEEKFKSYVKRETEAITTEGNE